MICKRCNEEIDNSKGGFITLANGDTYHAEWDEQVLNEDGEVIEPIRHQSCE